MTASLSKCVKVSFETASCHGGLADFTDIAKRLEAAQVEEMKVKEPVNQQIHRMCLLRVKLMHFVNSLHNYITTRVRTWCTAVAQDEPRYSRLSNYYA